MSRDIKSSWDSFTAAFDEQPQLATVPNAGFPAGTTIAMDPSKTPEQHKAMCAAAHGKSTIGIPKKVGEEFCSKDAINGHAAGILFTTPDSCILLLRRSAAEPNYGDYWELPGGKGEEGESPEDTAKRESREEIGTAKGSLKLVDSRNTPNGFAFHTFASAVAKPFTPKLNAEHTGYAWFPIQDLPDKLHPGVRSTVTERLMQIMPDQAGDMSETDWDDLKSNFLKWLEEEEDEPEHAEDNYVAFDYATERSVDIDGKLHVRQANISKANVCGYYGIEVPDYKSLGLEPTRLYKFYRDPDELRKATQTFNNLPILDKHVSFNTVNFDPALVVGSTGTDASFEGTYLQNSLVFWVRKAIDDIQAGVRKELSCAYRYRADMTPGAANGESYDGVMRDVIGNHVALVQRGRAGSDVVVSDSALPHIKEILMGKTVVLSQKAAVAKGVLLNALRPVLASNAKIDLNEILSGVTQANFKDKKTSIFDNIKQATTGKLVKDANLNGVSLAMDQLVDLEEPDLAVDEDKDAAPAMKPKMSKDKKAKDCAEDDDDDDKDKKKKDKAKDEDDDKDDDKDNKKKFMKKAEDEKDDKDKDDMVSKKAMDSAIGSAVENAVKRERDRQKAVRSAYDAVKPYVGELAVAYDSADEIYKAALKAMGYEGLDSIHPSAYPSMLKHAPMPGLRNRSRHNPVIASDSANGSKSIKDYFPGAEKIGHV